MQNRDKQACSITPGFGRNLGSCLKRQPPLPVSQSGIIIQDSPCSEGTSGYMSRKSILERFSLSGYNPARQLSPEGKT